LQSDNTVFGDRGGNTPRARSRLFTVRIWKEQTAGGWEYRGSVFDVVSGAFLGFRDWSDLCSFMTERMEEDETGRQTG
jgi:hypothetical protein